MSIIIIIIIINGYIIIVVTLLEHVMQAHIWQPQFDWLCRQDNPNHAIITH